MKKLISATLVFVLLCTMLSTFVFPVAAAEASGTTGECAWTLNGTVLTVSGKGIMEDYRENDPLPWGTSVTEVRIEPGVTSVGAIAFKNCTGLVSVSIPDSVAIIGNGAFFGCTGLTSITIPNGVTSIRWNAFQNCSGLETVNLGNSVATIGNNAFRNCTGLKSMIIPNSVTTIDWGAFLNCTGLTTVTIPNGVNTIGDSAFYGCTRLENVTIPDSVTAIAGGTFSGCARLKSVDLGNSVVSIGDYAFSECTGLTNMIIPDSVTSIGKSAFSNCSSLTDVYYTGTEEKWQQMTTDSTNEALSKATVHYNADVTDPGTVEPSGTTGACTWRLDGTVLTVSGNGAMGNYYESNSSPWGASVTEVKITSGVTAIGEFAFSGSTELKSVTIPDSVTSIGGSAFLNCAGLKNVTIPNNVTSIGWSTFEKCTGLESVNLGNRLTSIGGYAFSGCTGLKNVTIPGSVTTIGNSAFRDCAGLKTVTIPDSVTSIGEWVFFGCTGLTNVTVPNSITTINAHTFQGCTGLTNVTISNGITSISDFAFDGCTGLTSVTVPDSVDAIFPYAFRGCAGLTNVNLGNGVTAIGGSAFVGCSGLKNVTIPDKVTSIGFNAFSSCPGLTYVIIPKSVTDIGDGAFSGCYSLMDVYYVGTEEEWNQILTGEDKGAPSWATVHFNTDINDLNAANAVDALIEAIGKVTPDHEEAIKGARAAYDALTESQKALVRYRDTLIAAEAELAELKGTTGACSWRLDGTVLTLGGNGAMGNYDWGNSSPWGRSITEVRIAFGITAIGNFAFDGCAELKKVTIPDSVTSIGDHAFYLCNALTDVYFNGSIEEWSRVSVGGSNEALSKATIHFAKSHTEHSYDNACDPDCNLCGAVRTVTHSYNSACDPDCNKCGAARTITHAYDNACDTACNLCGVTRIITHNFGQYVYNNDATLEKDGTRTRTCIVCGYPETVSAPGTKLTLSNPFTDVKTNVYYEKPVLWAVEKGITKGTSAATFSPDKTCSRGEIVTFLWRANGCPEPQATLNPFTDVPANAYYSKAVLWAVEKGVTAGTAPDKFSPNGKCTREQIVTFLWRSEGKPVMGSANPFKDVTSGTYYHNAVLWAVENKITNGTSPTTFAPKADCTRGQIVTFLYRTLS